MTTSKIVPSHIFADKETVRSAAQGQWREILQSLAGLSALQTNTKTKSTGAPCPMCGGSDRYSFKNADTGGWACRNCGGGDGFELLQKVNGWTFSEAINQVDKWLSGASGIVPAETWRQQTAEKQQREAEKEKARIEKGRSNTLKKWEGLKECTGNEYTRHKQFSGALMQSIRQTGDTVSVPVYDKTGELISLQHFPGTKDDKGRSNRYFAKNTSTKGGFHQWGESSYYILIGESISTTDAGYQLAASNRLAVCAFSAAQLPSVAATIREKHPESQIVILADNDQDGLRYATKAVQQVAGCQAVLPPDGHNDWSDYLLAKGQLSPLTVEPMVIDGAYQPETENSNEPPAKEAHPGRDLSLASDRNRPIILNGRELSDHELAALSTINDQCCHTVVGGRHVVARQKYCPITGETTAFEPIEQFKNYFLHLPQVAGLNAGAAWIKWVGKHHKLGGVTFMPNTEICPPDVYNLWKGFRISAMQGDCSLYLSHLEKVICAGDQSAYKYLVGWLAHMVQKPDEKPSVAVFMRSVMGAGKDTMIRAISEILGIHATTQNGDDQITGKFQGALQEKLFVYINEAEITDNRGADRLKSLISEKEVSLELKGKDPVRIPNFARFVFSSNRDHVIQADPRERRYLMVEPRPMFELGSPEHYDYFAALHNWMDNGGSSYLLKYLLSYDLTEFNPHAAPSTALLTEQKLQSMKNSHQFIREWLDGCHPIEWPERIPAGDLTTKYQQWSETGTDTRLTATKAGRELSSVMKELGIHKGTGGDRCFYLSKLEVMKMRFASLYKTTIEEMFS